jgi:hypothetical protein
VPIPRERWIENRPTEIDGRETFGHWEGDLLIFRREAGKANVTSLVERKSRFTLLLANEDKRSTAVVAGIGEALRPLPEDARRTITLDRGSEFAAYPRLASELAVASYFCDPHSPWQKGSVENANGRVQALPPPPLRARGARADPPPPAQRHAPALPRLLHPARGLPGAPGGPDRAALISTDTCRTSRRIRRIGSEHQTVV